MKFSDLNEVNQIVNSKIEYKTDLENYNRTEFWEIGESVGDCEDYALAKLHMLLDRGWNIEQLRLATAWCETGEYHAILVVVDAFDEESKYTGNYVLDNRFPNIYQPEAGYMGIRYKWDKIQNIGGSKIWVKAPF